MRRISLRPLTDFPVAAFVMAAVFDVIATIGRHQPFARDFFRAGTYVMITGGAISVLAALTGFWVWLRSTEAGTRARRAASARIWIIVMVAALAAADIALRLNVYDSRTHPTGSILVLSIVVAGLVSLGAAFGATLVHDFGFSVETDVLPGSHGR